MNKIQSLARAMQDGALEKAEVDEQTPYLTAAILREAGVDPLFLARCIKEGLEATKIVTTTETLVNAFGDPLLDDDGKTTTLRKVKVVPDHQIRFRYASTVLAFLKPPPKETGQPMQQVNIYPTVTDDILAIKDPQEKMRAYVDRARAIAQGIPPSALKESPVLKYVSPPIDEPEGDTAGTLPSDPTITATEDKK